MKLAEALILRADCQKKIAQINERLIRNAKVQEGETPAEDPAALIAAIEQTSTQLVDLVQKINRTNVSIRLDGETIADAIARRDNLMLRQSIYRSLAEAATITQDRYMKSEIKFISTVAVTEIQKRADDLARDYRELDAKIQAANWNTELLS